MKPEHMGLMKMEMNLALERFKVVYKKASKGIEKIYTEAVLTNDPKELQKQYNKFFGFIKMSKNKKEKWN